MAVVWNPNVPAKISFRINCLSTDFSAQKGVKGIPLHLQIDTYEELVSDAEPIHRSFCQVCPMPCSLIGTNFCAIFSLFLRCTSIQYTVAK